MFSAFTESFAGVGEGELQLLLQLLPDLLIKVRVELWGSPLLLAIVWPRLLPTEDWAESWCRDYTNLLHWLPITFVIKFSVSIPVCHCYHLINVSPAHFSLQYFVHLLRTYKSFAFSVESSGIIFLMKHFLVTCCYLKASSKELSCMLSSSCLLISFRNSLNSMLKLTRSSVTAFTSCSTFLSREITVTSRG